MRVHFGNLSKEQTAARLTEIATPYGTVSNAEIVTDRETGESRGYGFIVFSTDAEAAAAKKGLNGTEVDGRKLRVD